MSGDRNHGSERAGKSSDDEPSRSQGTELRGIVNTPYSFSGDIQTFSWDQILDGDPHPKDWYDEWSRYLDQRNKIHPEFNSHTQPRAHPDETQGEQQASESTTNASRDVDIASPKAELDFGEFVQFPGSSPEKGLVLSQDLH